MDSQKIFLINLEEEEEFNSNLYNNININEQ